MTFPAAVARSFRSSVWTLGSLLVLALLVLAGCAGEEAGEASAEAVEATESASAETVQWGEWVSIWDGETFDGWRVNEENPESFSIEDGRIVVDGPRAHLFYDGPVGDADFDDFQLRAEVYTHPGANSGIFYHTEYVAEGWPQTGHEAQVNATHSDPRKTGSVYGVSDVMNDAPHEDEEWFTYHIIVEGQHVTHRVDGETVMEYTEPEDRDDPVSLGHGTIALQAHDPGSRVYYRNLEIRLPE